MRAGEGREQREGGWETALKWIAIDCTAIVWIAIDSIEINWVAGEEEEGGGRGEGAEGGGEGDCIAIQRGWTRSEGGGRIGSRTKIRRGSKNDEKEYQVGAWATHEKAMRTDEKLSTGTVEAWPQERGSNTRAPSPKGNDANSE